MTESVLLVDKADGLAVVTLNRPQRLNALSLELRHALFDTFVALEADPAMRVVILTGAGRAFSAGLDLEELGNGVAIHGRREPWADTAAAIHNFSGPVIGAINGVAVTGGLELALACDMLIASNQARFADTHGRVGLLAGWGLSQRLSRAIGLARAKELSLTGNFLDAATAVADSDSFRYCLEFSADCEALTVSLSQNSIVVLVPSRGTNLGARR